MISLREAGYGLVGVLLAFTSTVADELPPGAVARLGTPGDSPPQLAVPSVAFSPDGRTLACANSQRPGGGYQLTIHLWDVRHKCAAGKLEVEGMATSPLRYSADGRFVVVGLGFSSGGPAKSSTRSHERVQVWEVKTGKDLERFGTYTQHGYVPIRAVTFTPDGRSILSTRKQRLQTWDFKSGDLKAEKDFTTSTAGRWLSELFSPDRRTFATSWVRVTPERSEDGPIELWDLSGKKGPRRLKAAGLPQGFSPDGKLLAVRTAEKKLVVWDLTTEKQTAAFEADVVTYVTEGAAFTADRKRIAWFDRAKTVKLADLETGKVLATLPEKGEAVAFSPDGRTLVTLSADGTALLWDVLRLLKAESSRQAGP